MKIGFWLIYLKYLLQSDNDCCNSCEEVREAYRKRGWGLTNPDLIDQVNGHYFHELSIFFLIELVKIISKKKTN